MNLHTTLRRTAIHLCLLLCLAGAVAPLSAQELTQAHRDAYARCRELQKSGDWIDACAIAQELVAAFRNAPPSQHQLAFTVELANLEQRLGHYDAALPAYEASLATARELLGAESVPVAQIENNLAALHQILGNFEEAEKLNRDALRIRESIEGKDSPGTVPAMNNLATLFWCIGDLGGAESLYRNALDIRIRHLGPDALDTARSMANLGGLLTYRGHPNEAEPLISSAVGLFTQILGDEHPDTLEVMVFLGKLYDELGKSEAAIDLFKRVRNARIAALGTRSHVEVAEACLFIGDAALNLGNYPEAIASFQESEELYLENLSKDHPDLSFVYYGLGLARLVSGDTDGAMNATKRCLEIEFRNFDAMLQFTDERQRLAYQDSFKSHHLLAQLGAAEDLAAFLLRQKGVVADSLIAEAQLSKESGDPRVEDARRALAAARAEYRSTFLGSTESGRTLAALDAEVRERHRTLVQLIGAKDFSSGGPPPTVADLRASLKEGEALIDYLRYRRYDGLADFQDRYGAVVTTRDAVAFVDLCAAADTDTIVAAMIPFFGAANGEGDADQHAREVMETLYRQLIAPAEAALAGHTKLVICPERSLSFIPFACLVGPDGKFLVESHDIRYVSSARELIRQPSPGNPAAGAILVGNPAFDNGTAPDTGVQDRRGLLASFSDETLSLLSQGLAPLAGAEEEVMLLAPVLQTRLGTPVSTLKGAAATEEDILGNIHRPHILHFATHGLYLPAAMEPASEQAVKSPFVPSEVAGFQNPMFGSCLALTGSSGTFAAWSRGIVPDPSKDGLLMANEAAELDLDGTLLVALSACDTASGEATSGDGVLGLRRGFRMAGAENVISTLWPISDAATVGIMRQLYEGLATSTPADSLSATQREWLVKFRDRTDIPADDPLPVGGLYWAINLAGPFLLGR